MKVVPKMATINGMQYLVFLGKYSQCTDNSDLNGIAPPYHSELIAIKGHGAYKLRLSSGILLVPHP